MGHNDVWTCLRLVRPSAYCGHGDAHSSATGDVQRIFADLCVPYPGYRGNQAMKNVQKRGGYNCTRVGIPTRGYLGTRGRFLPGGRFYPGTRVPGYPRVEG
eukprot:3206083-Rhodomonas_salina.1